MIKLLLAIPVGLMLIPQEGEVDPEKICPATAEVLPPTGPDYSAMQIYQFNPAGDPENGECTEPGKPCSYDGAVTFSVPKILNGSETRTVQENEDGDWEEGVDGGDHPGQWD